MPLTKDETRLVANLCKQTLRTALSRHTHIVNDGTEVNQKYSLHLIAKLNQKENDCGIMIPTRPVPTRAHIAPQQNQEPL